MYRLIIQLVTVYFFFIETRGATLEEINRTFDGADAVEEVKHQAAQMEGVKDIRDIAAEGRDEETKGGITHVNEKTE